MLSRYGRFLFSSTNNAAPLPSTTKNNLPASYFMFNLYFAYSALYNTWFAICWKYESPAFGFSQMFFMVFWKSFLNKFPRSKLPSLSVDTLYAIWHITCLLHVSIFVRITDLYSYQIHASYIFLLCLWSFIIYAFVFLDPIHYFILVYSYVCIDLLLLFLSLLIDLQILLK